MVFYKEYVESDLEVFTVLLNSILIFNYNLFDFLKEVISVLYRILILIMMNVNESLKLVSVK